MVRRVDPNGEDLVWYRKCSGCARCRVGGKAHEPLQTRGAGHERAQEHVENTLVLEKRIMPDKKREGVKS